MLQQEKNDACIEEQKNGGVVEPENNDIGFSQIHVSQHSQLPLWEKMDTAGQP